MSSPLQKELPTKQLTSISTQTNLSIWENRLKGGNVPSSIIKAATKMSMKAKPHDFEYMLQRRLNPKTKEDFETLFREVEQWRDCKLKEIELLADSSNENKKEQKANVLSKETKLLRKIAVIKKEVIDRNSTRKLNEALTVLGSDEVWEMSNGEKILVETSAGKYASKLVEMHQELSGFENQEVTQRLEVLNRAKHILENITPSLLVKDTLELLNRECECLDRCMFRSLTGLRERLLNLYLQVIEQETGKKI